MWVRAGVVLALLSSAGAMAVPAAAGAQSQFCERGRAPCARVSVPLDRSGTIPGTVSLYIERAQARTPVRPPLFLIGGGLGQSATATFSPEWASDVIGAEAKARDVVVMDSRGTGRSDVLDCPSLQRKAGSLAVAAGECAERIGPRRAFYTANDAADDIEAVRASIGSPRIALLSLASGSELALAYAARYPGHVDRLVLDSPVEPGGRDPLLRTSMRAAPGALRAFCRQGGCAWTQDIGRDLTKLAGTLERAPLRGFVTGPRGRREAATIDSSGLLEILLAGDRDPFVRALGPGAIRSASRGDAVPLLRLSHRVAAGSRAVDPLRFLSHAARTAARCEQSLFPWSSTADPAQRMAEARARVAALPATSFGPFGPMAALGSDVLELCATWPVTPGRAPAAAPLPAVPTLLMASATGVTAPVANVQAIAARIPGSRVIETHGGGNLVMGGFDFNDCATRWTRRFLAGQAPGACERRLRPAVVPVPAPPAALAQVRQADGLTGRPARTLTAVRLTIADGLVALWGHGSTDWSTGFEGSGYVGKGFRLGALRGGSYVFRDWNRGYLLRGASAVSGVVVDGALSKSEFGDRIESGWLRVRGRAAARGRLRLRKGQLVGRLGGRLVHVAASLSPGHNLLKAPAEAMSGR
jgi:pimeloyl-ACP methyl ester carboxylesterase